MTTQVTKLFSSSSDNANRPVSWCIQFYSNDCSEPKVLKEVEVGKYHSIEKITVSSITSNKWLKIQDGDNDLIGPLPCNFQTYEFKNAVNLTKSNAIKIKTQEAFPLLIIIEGFTSAVPVKAFSPKPLNNDINIKLESVLSWDVSPQVKKVNIYFGENSPVFVRTQSEKTYCPPKLSGSTVYFWRIDSISDDSVIVGDEWTFTTI